MVELLATTIISCENALLIANRLSKVIGLSYFQRIEIVRIIKESIPSCPIVFKNHERTNSK